MASQNRPSEAKQGGMKISIIRETQALRATAQMSQSNFLVESRQSLNEAAGEEAAMDNGGLAYKDMNDFYYYSGTIIYYGVAVLGSCLIPSVDEIFEFVGTICVNCMGFIFPAVFYLAASKEHFGSRSEIIKRISGSSVPQLRSVGLERIAKCQICLGIMAFLLGMFNNIYGLIDHDAGE